MFIAPQVFRNLQAPAGRNGPPSYSCSELFSDAEHFAPLGLEILVQRLTINIKSLRDREEVKRRLIFLGF